MTPLRPSTQRRAAHRIAPPFDGAHHNTPQRHAPQGFVFDFATLLLTPRRNAPQGFVYDSASHLDATLRAATHRCAPHRPATQGLVNDGATPRNTALRPAPHRQERKNKCLSD